jgi:hypothetical protein
MDSILTRSRLRTHVPIAPSPRLRHPRASKAPPHREPRGRRVGDRRRDLQLNRAIRVRPEAASHRVAGAKRGVAATRRPARSWSKSTRHLASTCSTARPATPPSRPAAPTNRPASPPGADPASVTFNSATDPVYISDTAAGQMTRITARSRRRRDALVCEVRCIQLGGAFKNAVHAARPAASAHQQISGRLMDACMPYSLLARICLVCAYEEPRSGGV